MYQESVIVEFSAASDHARRLGFVAALADAHSRGLWYRIDHAYLRDRCTFTITHPHVYTAVLAAAELAQAADLLRIVHPGREAS